MKITMSIAAGLVLLLVASASAQTAGAPSGRGAVNGDPAASSASPSKDPRRTTGMVPSSGSGSGTSTSGGRDDNGDQGRDRMPNSNMSVRPQSEQPKRPPHQQ